MIVKHILELFEKYPKTRIWYLDKRHFVSTGWSAWKAYKDCTDEEKEQANLRELFPCEVVIDIEESDEENLKKIKEKINKKGYKYMLYKTGSRGYHIHLFFDKLSNMSDEERTLFRDRLIREFHGDLSKKSGVIALELRPHFKTGKTKTLIEETEGLNKIANEETNTLKKETEKRKELAKEQKQKTKEGFEDWHKNDKLFKYFSEGKIPKNNQRNNIIFKNFAVALVYEGLDDNKIKELIEPILKEYHPDKKYNELQGWINKVRKNEITDYNIYELNDWSKEFKHPIFYEEVVGKREVASIMDLKDLWNSIWEGKIVQQPEWRDLCFYNLISVVVDNAFRNKNRPEGLSDLDDFPNPIINEELSDLRINPFFTSPSGTGKDEGIDMVKEFLDALGFETSKPTDITDKYLLGGVKKEVEEYNARHGLSEENPEKHTGRGQYTYRSPVEKGVLATHDWIGFSEATMLFNLRSYSANARKIINQALNKRRYVEKGVGHYKIGFKSPTAFIFGTYMPAGDAIKKVLNEGFFQRCLYYNKEISYELIDEISNKIIEKTVRHKELGEHLDIYNAEFYKKLKKLREFLISSKVDNIDLSDMKEDFLKVYQSLKQKTKGNMFSDVEREILLTFIGRMLEHVKKIAILKALSEHRQKIISRDIEEGHKIALLSFNSLITVFKKMTAFLKAQILIKELLKKTPELKTMEIYDLMVSKKFSKYFTEKVLKELIEKGEVVETKDGREKKYSLPGESEDYF